MKRPIVFVLLAAMVIVGCRRSEPKPMTDSLADWKRDKYQRSQSHALVYYVIYGKFTNNLAISRSQYRTAGLPEGFSLHKLDRQQRHPLPFTDGEFGKGLFDQALLARSERKRRTPFRGRSRRDDVDFAGVDEPLHGLLEFSAGDAVGIVVASKLGRA